MAKIERHIFVNAPIEKVYAFARDPKRWNTWFTGLSAPEQVIGTGEKGTVVKHHYTMAGMTFPLTTRVTDDRPGPKGAHWRGEIEGPLAGHHDWTYVANDDSTEIRMQIEYTVPGKLLGQIADKLVIERLQEKAIEQTMENLRILCEAEVHAPVAK